MFGQATYLLWLALFLLLPLLMLGRWWRLFWAWRRAFGWMLLGALAGGWAWDYASVELRIWYYAPANTAGLWIGGLPIEEWLWIIGVPLLFGALTVILKARER